MTFLAPGTAYRVEADVEIGEDTVDRPGRQPARRTASAAAARSARTRPLATRASATAPASCTPSSSRREVHDGAHDRPVRLPAPGHGRAREGAKVGTFVEVKNSDIGAGAKVPHLSYIGDADVGEAANVGASTITANYDGRDKHRTKIGKSAKTGVHTSLRRARERRRSGVHWGRLGDHRGRPRGRARDRAGRSRRTSRATRSGVEEDVAVSTTLETEARAGAGAPASPPATTSG